MTAAEVQQLTPTQRRLIAVLADGDAHSYAQLLKCIDDDLATPSQLHYHVCLLRKRLPAGEEIVCQLAGYVRGYRHVRLLVPAAKS